MEAREHCGRRGSAERWEREGEKEVGERGRKRWEREKERAGRERRSGVEGGEGALLKARAHCGRRTGTELWEAREQCGRQGSTV